jgi:hypothetical protein
MVHKASRRPISNARVTSVLAVQSHVDTGTFELGCKYVLSPKVNNIGKSG